MDVTLTGPAAGRPRKKDPLQVVVHDADLEVEITLLMDVIVAVAHATIPLDQDAIDAILLPSFPALPGTDAVPG